MRVFYSPPKIESLLARWLSANEEDFSELNTKTVAFGEHNW